MSTAPESGRIKDGNPPGLVISISSFLISFLLIISTWTHSRGEHIIVTMRLTIALLSAGLLAAVGQVHSHPTPVKDVPEIVDDDVR